MNDFQREKQQAFRNQTYSVAKKQAIIQAVQTGQKRRTFKFYLKPVFAFIGILAISFILIQNINLGKTTTHVYTEDSLKQVFYETYSNEKTNQKVLYVELGKLEDNDGFIITKENLADASYYGFYYGQFENEQWQIEYSTLFNPYIENYNSAFELLRIYDDYESEEFTVLYIGALSEEDTPDEIIVGDKKIDIYNEKGLHAFWVEQVPSEATPVYFVKDNIRKNVKASTHFIIESLPLVEELPTDQTISGSSDMLGAYDTYTDYELVIDPLAYKTSDPDNGDVVLLKNGKLARILVTDKNGQLPLKVTISEGAVLLEDYFRIDPYMSSHFNGLNTIYDRSPDRIYLVDENQYFAKADNWGIEGAFEGLITKEDILGKVKGYSLMSIEPNISLEIYKAYNDFKENYDDTTLSSLAVEQIAILQKYAEYLGDYKTVYELFAKSSINLSYDDFLNTVSSDVSNVYKQTLLYEIDLLVRGGSFSEQDGKLEHIHPITNSVKLQMYMIKENGIWKVKYE